MERQKSGCKVEVIYMDEPTCDGFLKDCLNFADLRLEDRYDAKNTALSQNVVS